MVLYRLSSVISNVLWSPKEHSLVNRTTSPSWSQAILHGSSIQIRHQTILIGFYVTVRQSVPSPRYVHGHIEQTTTQPKGNRRISHNQSNGNLNPLKVLRVILGHIPESTIKRIVKNNLVNGLKFSYEQIKNLKLGLCPTCMTTKMKAFPIYPTMSIPRCFRMSIFWHHRVRATSQKYRRLSLRSILCRSLYEYTYGLWNEEKGWATTRSETDHPPVRIHSQLQFVDTQLPHLRLWIRTTWDLLSHVLSYQQHQASTELHWMLCRSH